MKAKCYYFKQLERLHPQESIKKTKNMMSYDFLLLLDFYQLLK